MMDQVSEAEFYGIEVTRPDLDVDFSEFQRFKSRDIPRRYDWVGGEQPWRYNDTHMPVTDLNFILREEEELRKVIADDCSTVGTAAHGQLLRDGGVTVGWLLAFTFDLDLWEWTTKDVVRYIIRPATACHGRCRFVSLPCMRGHTGTASVYMAHTWEGKWGNVVMGACTGARKDRVVWVDVFAVRQWPNCGADLEFRSVLCGCTALIMVAEPIRGTKERYMPLEKDRGEVERSPAFQQARKTIPFCRLWPVVELHAAAVFKIPVLFMVGYVRGDGTRSRIMIINDDAKNTMLNFKFMIDVEKTEAFSCVDRKREMAAIRRQGGIDLVNDLLRAALAGGASSANLACIEVTSLMCGEPEAIRRLNDWDKVSKGFAACVAQGLVGTMLEMLELCPKLSSVCKRWAYPYFIACQNGHVDAAIACLDHFGGDVNLPLNGMTACFIAAQNNHPACLELNIKRGCNVNTPRTSDNATPLYRGSFKGNATCIRLLLDAGADQTILMRGWSPRAIAYKRMGESESHMQIYEMLKNHPGFDMVRDTVETV